MKNASAIARYLAGVIFLVFGLNGFLNFIALPPPGGLAGQRQLPLSAYSSEAVDWRGFGSLRSLAPAVTFVPVRK